MSTGTDVIYVDTDSLYKILGVYNEGTGSYVNDATVELTLLDSNDDEITGQTWPLTLTYGTSSDGDYVGQISDAINVTAGSTGTAVIDIDGAGLQTQLRLPVSFAERDQATLPWTSRSELDNLFGRSNITTWADLENEEDATQIRQRVRWAVDEATAEARERLSTLVNMESLTVAPRSLRLTVTRLAGVLLYESRGIKDSAEEDGKNRLQVHKTAVDRYFREIAAGRRILTLDTSSVPAVIKDVDTLSSDGTTIFSINDL